MNSPWTKETRDRWFYAALAASFLSLAWLFWSYAAVLLFSAVFVVVTWPLFERILAVLRGRRAPAALGTLGLLALVVLGPMGFLAYIFAREAVSVVQLAIDSVQSGELEQRLLAWSATLPLHEAEAWLGPVLPAGKTLVASLVEPLRAGALMALNAVGNALPGLLNAVVGGGINAVIFLLVTASLYMEGPRVLDMFRNLSPLDDAYEKRLFGVFREFATNMVVGSLATAFIQGVVATTGYWIAGAERVVFLGILTAVGSFVPMVGTLAVWLPIAVWVAAHHGWPWGVFVAAWSLGFTGTVDNVLKPLFLRGSSDIHPGLIFLGVFGGLGAMGLPGLLVGPMCVAVFLALYRIYKEDYLGIAPEPAPPVVPSRLAVWFASLSRGPSPAPAVAAPPILPAPPPVPPEPPAPPTA